MDGAAAIRTASLRANPLMARLSRWADTLDAMPKRTSTYPTRLNWIGPLAKLSLAGAKLTRSLLARLTLFHPNESFVCTAVEVQV